MKRKCESCGVEFTINKYNSKYLGWNRFCSKNCAARDKFTKPSEEHMSKKVYMRVTDEMHDELKGLSEAIGCTISSTCRDLITIGLE